MFCVNIGLFCFTDSDFIVLFFPSVHYYNRIRDKVKYTVLPFISKLDIQSVYDDNSIKKAKHIGKPIKWYSIPGQQFSHKNCPCWDPGKHDLYGRNHWPSAWRLGAGGWRKTCNIHRHYGMSCSHRHLHHTLCSEYSTKVRLLSCLFCVYRAFCWQINNLIW